MAKTDKQKDANTTSPSAGTDPAAPQQTADTGVTAAANPGTPVVNPASTGAQSGASVPPPAVATPPGTAPAAPQQTADTGVTAAANPGTPVVNPASTGAQSGASVPPPAAATPPGTAPAATGQTSAEKPKRYRIVAPKKVTRQRIGLDFKNGEALTSNAFTAHAAMEIGCRVFYTENGDPAFGTEEPEVQAVLDQRAVAARW